VRGSHGLVYVLRHRSSEIQPRSSYIQTCQIRASSRLLRCQLEPPRLHLLYLPVDRSRVFGEKVVWARRWTQLRLFVYPQSDFSVILSWYILDWHFDVFGVFKTALGCHNEICPRHRTWKMEVGLVDVKGRRVRQSVDETIHGLE